MTTTVLCSFPLGSQALSGTISIAALNPQSIEVRVTPTQGGWANFTTTVHVTKANESESVSVLLKAKSSTDWSTKVSPASIVLSGKDQNFKANISIFVPAATRTASIGKVTVNGTATVPEIWSATALSSATVTVFQYFKFDVNYTNQTWGNDQEVTTVVIKNTGNGLDSFSVDVANLKQLTDEGMTVTIDKGQIDNLPDGETVTINITVKAPHSGSISNKTLMVEVKSQNAGIAGQTVTKTMPVSVDPNNPPNKKSTKPRGFLNLPGFDPVLLVLAIVSVGSILALRKRLEKN